jgi:hypothetical protein
LKFFPIHWLTTFNNAQISTTRETLQSIKPNTIMQEALDPPCKDKPKPSIKATTSNNGQGGRGKKLNNNSRGAGRGHINESCSNQNGQGT